MDPPEPLDFELLTELEQLRCLANADRLAILRRLGEGPRTGTMLAHELGESPNRVHYHVRQLLAQGLVRLHATGRKRWKEERFYVATARHYLVDPALACHDPETTRSLLRSFELAFLDWRRKQVLEVDLGVVARRIVQDCLKTARDERVLVMTGPIALEVAEAIVVELEAVGARPFLKAWSRNVILRTLDRHDAGELARVPFLHPAEMDELDAGVFVNTNMPQGEPPNQEQRAKLPILMRAVSEWNAEFRRRKRPFVELMLPHRGELEGGTLTPEQSLDVYWRCVTTDVAVLRERAERLLERTGTSAELLVQGPEGGRLELGLSRELDFAYDGEISAADRAAGRCFEELPAGVVGFVPAAGSARGTLRCAYAFARGRHFRDLALEVRDGRLVELSGEGADELRAMMAAETGTVDRLASVRIGLNPSTGGLTGKALLDACLEGVVTLDFGSNEVHGGDLSATLDLSFPNEGLTVRAGDAALVLDGVLQAVPE